MASWPRAGTVARADPPTCSLDDRRGDAGERARMEGWDLCVVVNGERVVLGILREEQLEGDPDTPVEEAMRPGPSTFRPHVPIVEMARYLLEHDLTTVPVTTGDGVLVGVLRREDAARAALEWQREHGEEHHDG